MSKHTIIKRSLSAGLVIGAASFPTIALARPIEAGRMPVAGPTEQLASTPVLPSSSAQSGFQWDDAGIGAGGATVLLGAAALGTGMTRRRRETVIS